MSGSSQGDWGGGGVGISCGEADELPLVGGRPATAKPQRTDQRRNHA
jgi:hypothetical protein